MATLARTQTDSLAHRLHANRGMIFPLACVSLLLVLLIPLPPAVLDLLLILNLTLSVIILVTAIYIRSPREFAVFPSLLLAITLFRLVLSVATTRLILSGPGTLQFDGSVMKSFPIGDNDARRLQFKGEFFNIANSAQFNNPSSAIGRAGAGAIT